MVDQAERDEMFCLRMMAGELRWIQQKDRAIELLMLAEARRMEDLYFQTRSPNTGKNYSDQMDSDEDDALYLAIEMVEDLPLDGGDATKADKPEPRVENSVGNDWVEFPPLLRKRK